MLPYQSTFPVFKSKHDNNQSYRTVNQGNNIRIVGKHIKLPKIGYLRIKQTMDVGHINSVTVERTPTGKYFVVLNVDFEPEFHMNNGGLVGIDVGLKAFYTDSNGNMVFNPKFLEKSLHKLKHEQRKLSRMIEANISSYRPGPKGGRIPVYKRPLSECSNIQKQRIKVARIYEKVCNQRYDFLQKLSTMLIRENQTICIEDLNVKGMVRNHKLARAISSVSWSQFFSMLEYKAAWYGNNVIRVPTNYPSSQTCSCCGNKNPLVKDGTVRDWECPVCHAKHDRDHNASLNILRKELEILNQRQPAS